MNKLTSLLKTRRDTVRGLIDELEKLRPRAEMACGNLERYAYNQKVAAFIVAGRFCLMIAISLLGWSSTMEQVNIISVISCVICFTVYFSGEGLRVFGKKKYVLATSQTVQELENRLDDYRECVKKYDQREHDLREYRPKFERLAPIILGELNGKYTTCSGAQRFKVKVSFGKYKNRFYEYNEGDYAILVFRIVKTHHKSGATDDLLAKFVHDFEQSL